MSSAGRELHAAGPGDALPAQRPASAAPCAAPGTAAERPASTLPPEPHGWTLGACEPSRRPPLVPGEAPRPEEQQQEMRGGGLERPGWCEGGPRLPSCGAKGRPGEKEFQPIQKGREHVASPSCLEMKDLLQNLEESPAKVPVASEKQSGLPKEEAPGMKADGTGLCCNAGEPRAQARTGALLEASPCSGGVVVSGSNRLVSPEPPSPSSAKGDEEVPTSARQMEGEAFQNPGQGTKAVWNSRPSIQQGTFGPPGDPSLALALDVGPRGPRLEGQALQGSSLGRTSWGDCVDLSQVACEVQEGTFKSNPSGGRMEDLGEAAELQMAESPLQAGSPGRELSNNEPKGGGSMDLFSSPVHKGMIRIQKGSAGHSCWKGEGEHFPSKRSMFLSPAEPLVAPKDQERHSDIGRFSLCDGVQAALEDELRVRSSEASRIQEDKSSSLRHEKWITLGQRNGALLSKRHNLGSFQNSCSIKYVSTSLSCWAPQLDFGGNGLPLRVDNLGTAFPLCDLALPQWATSSFCVFADEKSLKVPQLCGPSPFAQKADPSSGHGGPMDSLSPEGVIVMQNPGAWPHHKEAFAPSQASGRLQARMNEGAWEMVRWVLRGAENGEVAMEAFWRKALRLRVRAVNDLPSAPEEIYALARNLFLDCRHLQESKIAFSLGISPALLESSGRFTSLPKKFSCSPYRNNWAGLDRAGRPLNSVYPLEVPCFSLSKAEAEKWSINGGDAFEGSESILERKGDIFPPYERVEVHKASHGADAGGMKTGNAAGCSNTRLSLQRAFDGDLSKTPLLCRATFRKSQCLEEQEKYQSHPSSPASNLSHLNRKDSSLCTKCSALQREPIYQMKIFLHPCYSLDSCTLFEQKNDSPKTEFLECQQLSLIFYKKLNYHDLQTVIRSVIKYVRCNKNKSLHSKRELKVTPSATTALLTEYQGPFHKIVTESSNNNTGSEFTGNLPNEDLSQSQSPRTLSRSSASESLNRNDFVKKWAPRSKTHDLHSASESIHKRPSGKFNFEKGLLSARKLVSSPFQTGPAATSAQIKGQERMKGLLLKPYRKRKILSLLSAGLGSQFPQNKKMCLLPKEAALASPSHSSPLAQRHCRVSLPRERGAGLESKRESSSPGRDAAAACSLLSRRTGQHCKGPRVEALLSLYPLEQPLEDLEADPREAGRTAGMMEGFPVRILSDTEVSSEALLGNLLLPLGGGQVTFPLKAAIHTELPLGLPEDFSESDSGKAKDSSEPPVTWRQVESPSCAPQAELFLSLRKQAEALGSSVPSSSSSGLKGGSFAGFPPWPSVKEGHPLRVERGQGLAGGPGEGPEGHLVDEHRRRGDSEAGAQPPAPKEKPPVGRRPALGDPAGNSSGEKAEGLGELARSTWTSLGRAGQKRRQQEPPAHMQKESKRQKRGQGCGEPASLNLLFWNRCRQACWPGSVGAFGPFPPAVGCDQSRSPGVFGYLRLQRPFPAFRKLSGAACIKAGMPRWLRAPKPLASKGELVYSAQSATEPAAPQPVVLWDPPVKQQGHSSSSLAVSWLAGQPKDAALLTRLSRLAEELLSPACRPFLPRRALLPPAAKWGPQRRRRKRRLLEIFSLVSLRLSSPPWLSSCCFKMAGSQALPVYSVESTVLCFFELSSDPPCRCSPPGVSPLPFHHQMDIGPPGKLPEAGSPSLVPMFPLRGPQPQPPSAWSLFFLLPQGCLDAMLIQKDAEPGSASARKEGEAVARSPGCPTPGLPSALALFSPSCYRAWTRRRRYPSGRTLAAQRLSLLHFARGFKGLQDCASVPAGLFSALPSLLGSVLSTWSQQRPSIHLSESTPLHSGPSRGPPALPATASLSHRTSPSLPPLVPGLPSDPSGAVKNDVRLESILSVLLPTSCQGPEPAHPPLGFPALGSGDGHEASVPALPKTGAQLAKDKSENRPKKVSQIRIRKTIPKPDPNLTPMGLPRPKRLKKTEFSLEEIYTNQNYKSPPATRCLETIFEEPKEKNGSLISISHQKRKRILEFQDFTVPRKRRARSRVRVTGGSTRAQKAAGEGRELDVLLIQKLADLETFFAKEETQEQASSCS